MTAIRKSVRALVLALGVGFAGSTAAAAMPREVATVLPAAKSVGSTEVRFLLWRVFDAELWSDDRGFSWQRPLALSLTYRRDFSAEELTDSTIEEMQRINGWSMTRLAAIRGPLVACLPSVSDGDRITAFGPTEDRVVLYLNGTERCVLEEGNLRRAFFNIWLSQNSQFPDESRELIGLAD